MFVPSVLTLTSTLRPIIVGVDFPSLQGALLANYLLGDHTNLCYHCVRHLCLLSLCLSPNGRGGVAGLPSLHEEQLHCNRYWF